VQIYHESDLRRFRVSAPGLIYAVTKTVLGRDAILVADPRAPDPHSDAATVIADSLRWHHQRSVIRCLGYVVMPDHFHFVFRLGDDWELSKLMKILSQYTARKINERLGRAGRLWRKGYYDHRISDDEDLQNQIGYLRQNPVRAGYVSEPEA
jgi:REP element-mobilizing transposase RayT